MNPKHEVYIQWLERCECGANFVVHGIVRVYRAPIAELLDGLPCQPWIWCCNFTLRGLRATMYAALTAPPAGTLRLLLAKAKELGVTELLWERVEQDRVRLVRFRLDQKAPAPATA